MLLSDWSTPQLIETSFSVFMPYRQRFYWTTLYEILSRFLELLQWHSALEHTSRVVVGPVIPQHDDALLKRIRSHLVRAFPAEVRLICETSDKISTLHVKQRKALVSYIQTGHRQP